jgi:hypothetical protein
VARPGASGGVRTIALEWPARLATRTAVAVHPPLRLSTWALHVTTSLQHSRPSRRPPMLRCGRKVVVVALGYAGLSVASRRWHRSWGTPAEAATSLPGDELIVDAALQTTRGIDIHAPPGMVWPWLVQMGQGRGGLCTYEWIENLLGAKIRNLDRIEPHLQHLHVGDHIRLTPEAYLGRIPGQYYRVTEIGPERTLVMLQQLPTGGLSSWRFNLRPLGASAARLLVRARPRPLSTRADRVAREVELLLLEPGYFVMERGMLRGLKTRAERTHGITGVAAREQRDRLRRAPGIRLEERDRPLHAQASAAPSPMHMVATRPADP